MVGCEPLSPQGSIGVHVRRPWEDRLACHVTALRAGRVRRCISISVTDTCVQYPGTRSKTSWQQKKIRSSVRLGSVRKIYAVFSSSPFFITFFLLTQPGTGHKKVERRSGRKWSSLLHTAISTRRRSSHKRPREKEPRVVADPLHTASRLLARA